MELFDRNQYLTPEEKQKRAFKQIRELFRKKNHEMTDTIKEKTSDIENIDYSQVHLSIYQGKNLGKEWRVDSAKRASEIETASDGFTEVTRSLERYPTKSLFFQQVLHKIKTLFSKK